MLGQRRWAGAAGVACFAASGCGAPDSGTGTDTGASSFVANYSGTYRATRMQTTPSVSTTQEMDPGYNIVASDAGGGAVLFQVTTTCSFRAVSRGAFLAVESGQRCVGFPGRTGQFTTTGGTAQRDGTRLTLTVSGDYIGSTDDGRPSAGVYTWIYTGTPR